MTRDDQGYPSIKKTCWLPLPLTISLVVDNEVPAVLITHNENVSLKVQRAVLTRLWGGRAQIEYEIEKEIPLESEME